MIKELINLRLAVDALCGGEESLRLLSLNDGHWIILQKLCSVLEIFVDATVKLSGSSYPTLAEQLPWYIVLSKRLEDQVASLQDEDPSGELLTAVNNAWVKIDEYHVKTGSAQTTATILDPRLKLQTFRTMHWREEWIQEAKQEFMHIYNTKYAQDPSSRPASPTSDDDMDEYSGIVFGSQVGNAPPPAPDESEIELYLRLPVIKKKANVLDWWQANGSQFPTLARMARDFMASPATSVPAEAAFSVAGQIISKRRAQLGDTTMSIIMCCRNWLGLPEYSARELIEAKASEIGQTTLEDDPVEEAGRFVISSV